MANFFNKIIEALATWLFTNKPTHTCSCQNKSKDEKEEPDQNHKL